MNASSKRIARNHVAFARHNIAGGVAASREWRRVAQHALGLFHPSDDECEAADFLIRFAARQLRAVRS